MAGLSRDSSLLALVHAQHGDTIHLAVRVVDARTGEVAGEHWDGSGLGLAVAGWSPVEGDERLALLHEKDGLPRPAVWNLRTGERRDHPLDLPGDVAVEGWWPDASALLLVHHHEGRSALHRLDLETGRLWGLDHPQGTVSGAGVRPDGEVWLRLDSGAAPPTVRTLAGEEIVAPPGQRAPAGPSYRSWLFSNPAGQSIHGFVATPRGTARTPWSCWFTAAPHGPTPTPSCPRSAPGSTTVWPWPWSTTAARPVTAAPFATP